MRTLLFFFNDTATTEIYTLSLHDALPIYAGARHPQVRDAEDLAALVAELLLLVGLVRPVVDQRAGHRQHVERDRPHVLRRLRSEEHTSELQSRQYLVCRLLLEKKKQGSHQ